MSVAALSLLPARFRVVAGVDLLAVVVTTSLVDDLVGRSTLMSISDTIRLSATSLPKSFQSTPFSLR